MKRLGSLLNKRKEKIKISLTDKDIFYLFEKVVREEFGRIGAAKLKAEYFKNKTIFVRAESANWGSELFSNRVEIIEKINKQLGGNIIHQIKIR